MHSHDLEDLTLLLIRDEAESEMWIDRWALGYPTVRTAAAVRSQSPQQWQRLVQTVWEGIRGRNAAVVAHGAGVSAFLAWLYRADLQSRGRLCNIILAAPLQSAFPDDAEHSLQRVRCPCRAALVIGQNDPECPPDWAAQQAALWRATLLTAPQTGRLNTPMQGWQWGMKLMQEMLLS